MSNHKIVQVEAFAPQRFTRLVVVSLVVSVAILLNIMICARGEAFSAQSSAYRDVTSLPPYLMEEKVAYGDQAEELRLSIKDMAVTLFASLSDPDPEMGVLADGVAMGSFVDLSKLTRTSSFGRYLAEQLMTEFQQYGYRVIEVRKSRSFLVQEKRGEYGLSRDLNEISPTVEARTMVTGTYSISGDQIMVNARVLDNDGAALLASSTIIVPKNRTVNLLLSDSASARRVSNDVTYMKRLE